MLLNNHQNSMTFRQKLETIVDKNNSLLCVGLDSNIGKLPQHLKSVKNPQFNFNKAIIDATCDLVCAYKPNTAFYEARGADGILDLKLTIDYLRKNYPQIVVILDAKRADIDNSNEGYVKFAFDYLGSDAITVHPYLGGEALKPFLDRKDKGIFILCRTTNLGAGEFQDLAILQEGVPSVHLPGAPKRHLEGEATKPTSEVEGLVKPLYQIVAEHVIRDWNYNGNCGLVVGATYPNKLQIVRRIVKDLPLLIPGIGFQGADIEKTVKFAVDKDGRNAIINSSRAVIFASSGTDFTQKSRVQADKLCGEINNWR